MLYGGVHLYGAGGGVLRVDPQDTILFIFLIIYIIIIITDSWRRAFSRFAKLINIVYTLLYTFWVVALPVSLVLIFFLFPSERTKAILISGESGAGKTEATKQCFNFLAEVAGSQVSEDANAGNHTPFTLRPSKSKGLD